MNIICTLPHVYASYKMYTTFTLVPAGSSEVGGRGRGEGEGAGRVVTLFTEAEGLEEGG